MLTALKRRSHGVDLGEAREDPWDLLVTRDVLLAPHLTTREIGRLASCCRAFRDFTLQVSRVSIGQHTSEAAVDAILRLLRNKQLPQLLVFKGHPRDAAQLVLQPGACPHLQTLDLDIDIAGVEALAAALRQPGACPQLNLRCNNLGDAGAEALAQALRSCPQLAKKNKELNEKHPTHLFRKAFRGYYEWVESKSKLHTNIPRADFYGQHGIVMTLEFDHTLDLDALPEKAESYCVQDRRSEHADDAAQEGFTEDLIKVQSDRMGHRRETQDKYRMGNQQVYARDLIAHDDTGRKGLDAEGAAVIGKSFQEERRKARQHAKALPAKRMSTSSTEKKKRAKLVDETRAPEQLPCPQSMSRRKGQEYMFGIGHPDGWIQEGKEVLYKNGEVTEKLTIIEVKRGTKPYARCTGTKDYLWEDTYPSLCKKIFSPDGEQSWEQLYTSFT